VLGFFVSDPLLPSVLPASHPAFLFLNSDTHALVLAPSGWAALWCRIYMHSPAGEGQGNAYDAGKSLE
jgi:hypothetical protein